MDTIQLKVYTEKSVVLCGDTIAYNDELLNSLGGKWNLNLTDKSSGEKFGGWIFPVSKKIMLEKWIKSKLSNKPLPVNRDITVEQRLTNLETKLDKILSLIEKIVVNPSTKSHSISVKSLDNEKVPKVCKDEYEYEYDGEIDEVPTKRLLGRK